MNIYQDEFVNVVLNPEQKLLLVHWFLVSEEMKEEHFKVINQRYLEWTEAHGLQKMPVNNTDFRFVILPELQEWVVVNIIEPIVAIHNQIGFCGKCCADSSVVH